MAFNRRSVYIGFLIALTLVGCTDKNTSDTSAKKLFVLSDTTIKHISIDTVKNETLHGVLHLTGRVTADESKIIDVYPFVGGTVTRVAIELGDFVHKGQVLAVIRSGEVADYERQLIDARSNVAVAQKNLAVQQDLLKSKLSSERDMISAQRDVDQAKADLQRIEEIYKIYSFSKGSEYIVKAPSDGFVIRKDINTDMTLRADRASSIFTITQLNDVWVIADVYENDISKVTPGAPAEITTIAYPDSVIYSKVDKVFNVLDEHTRTMSVRMRLTNGNSELKPGMAATVNVRYQRQGEMIAIPSSAIVFDHGKNYVIVYRDRRNIQVREVQVAETVEHTTYISSGLALGELVVSQGQLFIYDALTD